MLGLLAGFVIGLVLAAPLGPLGMLAAYQAAGKHMRAAWMLAVGACMADSLLALVATWSTELPLPARWLDGGLTILMAGLAVHLAMTARRKIAPMHQSAGVGLGLGATLLHPINLVTFGLAFSWLHDQGLVIAGWPVRLGLMVGVFTGAIVVWGILIEVARRLGEVVPLARFQTRFKYGLALVCMLTAVAAAVNFVRAI